MAKLQKQAGRRVYYLAALAIIAMVVVSAVALARPPPGVMSTGTSSSTMKTIQVTGTGTLSAAPDQAILDLAVETQAPTATQAITENSAAMTNVFNTLMAAGVSKDSIQTSSYTLSPVYSNPANQNTPATIIAYDAVNAIQVTFTDLSSVGKVLDQAISAGVNQVQGITFTLSSATMAKLQKQALQLALQDADNQAKATAASLDVTIVGPVSVSPAYVFQPINYNRFAASAETPTPIQSGTLQVTATVQVTYQFS